MLSWTKASAGFASGAALTSTAFSMAIAATSAASSTAYHDAIAIFGVFHVLARAGRWIISVTLTLPNEIDGPRGDIMANAETQVQVPVINLFMPMKAAKEKPSSRNLVNPRRRPRRC